MHTSKALAICVSTMDAGYNLLPPPKFVNLQLVMNNNIWLTPPFPKHFYSLNTVTSWGLYPAGYHSCFCVPSWLTIPVRTIRHFRKKDEREGKDSHQNRTYCVFATPLVNSLLTLHQKDSTTHFPVSVYRQRTPLIVSGVASHSRSPQNKA